MIKYELVSELERITNDILKKILNIDNNKELSEFYSKYIGNNGIFNEKKKYIILNTDNNFKKEVILKINFFFEKIKKAFENKKKNLINKELSKENIDITLPSFNFCSKGINPIYLVKEEIINIFLSLGFNEYDSTDIDSEHYNFTLMNVPKDHVSRDIENTFYINKELLLCTHTSHSQAKIMEKSKGKPIKIISPGKCFRKDDDDLTHSHQFMQIEGLMIDKNINLGNLKEILEIFVKKVFGNHRKTRLRNSFFPFTEPSIEMDIMCDNCLGKGCNKCKNSGYIEVLGAGIVNPDVLKMNGYNPKKYSGFAFGIGIERIAILKYGIDNIKNFYTNDIKFLNNFKG